MRLIFRLYVSILILLSLTSNPVKGQRFLPHTLMAGLDVPTLIRTAVTDGRSMGEIQLSTNIASHGVIFEYGFENVDRTDSAFQFSTRGPYFRAGVDFTLNPKNPQGHKIFTGFRYGQSNFKNSLNYQIESTPFDNPELNVENNNLVGSWYELTFGIKLMIAKNFAMGYTMRYKFSRSISGAESLVSYDLPGYGLASKNNNFGVSYYFYYRFKFRKERVPESGTEE